MSQFAQCTSELFFFSSAAYSVFHPAERFRVHNSSPMCTRFTFDM